MEINQLNTKNIQKSDAGNLTNSSFWDECYAGRELIPFNDTDYKKLVSIQTVKILEGLQIDHKKVCELGGGDAQMLTYLARKYPSTQFSILDYSERGCQLAAARATKEAVSLGICQADVFAPPSDQLERFDIVLSQGVVEHFTDLPRVLAAKRALLTTGGKMFTSIPNFSSPVYAWLCKKWSPSVWEDHVPHTLQNFIDSHEQANMRILKAGYIGTVEFGMLSMAMVAPEKKSSLDRLAYLYLTRLSKLIHLIEHKGIKIPSSRIFSPFIYVISSKDK